MSGYPLVSVVVAVYNGARHVEETVASILGQTLGDLELIVVDDASTDETPTIVARVGGGDPRLRLIRRAERGGPFVAANQGLRESTGEFVARCDADDVSFPNRLERQVGFLRSHEQLGGCGAFCRLLLDSGPGGRVFAAPLTSQVLKWELCLRDSVIHSSACLRRSAFEAIGWYRPEPVAQDYRLWCELARRHWLAIVPEELVYFRHHERRISVQRALEQDRLAREVMKDHLRELGTGSWSESAVASLQAVGRPMLHDIDAGLAALARWDRCWQHDEGLSEGVREELARISAFRRRRFLRENARRQPGAFLRNGLRYLSPSPRSHVKASPWGRTSGSGQVTP